jgi:hypothetical protein
MAQQGLNVTPITASVIALVLLALGAGGCGDPPPVNAPVHTEAPPKADASPEFAESTWGKFHSERFQLTLPLPDGKKWKIDDHTQPALVARHVGTSSVVTVYTSVEHELVNHQGCEDRARAMGLVPKEALRTVESTITVGPDAYDSRIWIAIDGRPDADARHDGKHEEAKDGHLTGHVFLFGAYIRKCLFLHLSTTVPSLQDEPRLSARLASARVSMIGDLKVDPPRTGFDSDNVRGPTK